jgi:CubicO group peptidase (beta-lactamase class C family)
MYNKLEFLLLIIHISSFIFFSSCSENGQPPDPQYSSLEEEIDHLVEQYSEVGAAIGVINNQQEQIVLFYGTKTLNENDPPDTNTVFQIGSITKIFTGTLLADMILNGSVGLEDAVGHYLPAEQVTMPTFNSVEVKIKHLATHSSGIPKRPFGSSYPVPPGFDPVNSYAAYTTEHIYDYLTNYCTLAGTPGTVYLYSNIGVGLLGHTLGRIEKSSYEAILNNRIIKPLGMNSTSIFVTDTQTTNLAMGYSANFEPRPNWDANDIFQGAGFINSSLNDMMIFLKANMGIIEHPLEDAIALAHQIHFDVGTVTYDDRPGEVYEYAIGLGWQIHEDSKGRTWFRHGGNTNSQSAYIGFDLSILTGVVILCNYQEVDVYNFGDKVLTAINNY